MLMLTIKTDNPLAEIGLYENKQQLAYETWQADRQLSTTIHTKIKELLNNKGKDWNDIKGIVCYKGPGSFTGLRIGLTVGNSLAYGLGIPIVSDTGNNWIENALKRLANNENEKVAMPEYGADAHITKPRK